MGYNKTNNNLSIDTQNFVEYKSSNNQPQMRQDQDSQSKGFPYGGQGNFGQYQYIPTLEQQQM